MNREQMLLGIAGEECAEVAQRCSKAQRFGLSEIQPGQSDTNRERILAEFADLYGVLEMLGLLPLNDRDMAGFLACCVAKKQKVEKYLKYSAECGQLVEASSVPPSAPPPPRDWQPIETAPKDKLFLGYGEIISGVFSVDICMWWKGNDLNRADWTDNSGHYLVKLTHWMPLPSAPDPPSPAQK